MQAVAGDRRPRAGDPVRVKASVERPSSGWGHVQRGEVGTVLLADGNMIVIDFPSEQGTPWIGAANEIEVVVASVTDSGGVVANAVTADDDVIGGASGGAEGGGGGGAELTVVANRAPAAGDRIRVRGAVTPTPGPSTGWKNVAPFEVGEVLVAERAGAAGASPIVVTAIFPSAGGAPWVGPATDLEVVVPKTEAGAAAAAHADVARRSPTLSAAALPGHGGGGGGGGGGGEAKQPASSVWAQAVDDSTLDGVDDATKMLLRSIMLEEEEAQRQRRAEALERSNAEIAGSAQFGVQTDIMKLRRQGPKIRIRKKIVLPREWAVAARSGRVGDGSGGGSGVHGGGAAGGMEEAHLFAVALFDAHELARGGLQNVTPAAAPAANAASGAATPATHSTFKRGDLLCVFPPSAGGPWWRFDCVDAHSADLLKTSASLRAASAAAAGGGGGMRDGSGEGMPRINRNFVQPLVSFYRLLDDPLNAEFHRVRSLFTSAVRKGNASQSRRMRVTAIHRIQNRDLWEDFHVRRERIDDATRGAPDVRLLYSGAGSAALVLAIATQGFDWRLHALHAAMGGQAGAASKSAAASTPLGQGFYFDARADRAHAEAGGGGSGTFHMILARVCVGRTVAGRAGLRRPPPGFHSAEGNGKVVVFDFCQAYPLYHVEYSA